MTKLEAANQRAEEAKMEAEQARLVAVLVGAKDAEAAADKQLAEAKDDTGRDAAKANLALAKGVVQAAAKGLIDQKKAIENQKEVNLVCAGGSAPKGYFSNLLTAIF